MILDKTVMMQEENDGLPQIVGEYYAIEATTEEEELLCQELRELREKMRRERIYRYICSFSGRKEAVLQDVREILAAVEKSDFEKIQNYRRSVLFKDENLRKDETIIKLLKKDFMNFLGFLIKITSAQSAVIHYDPDSFLTRTVIGAEAAEKSGKKMSKSDKELFDQYFDLLIEKAASFYRMPKEFPSYDSYCSLSFRFSGGLILQNKAINAFSHISNRSFSRTDAFSERGLAVQEDVEITIDDIGDSKFNVSTQKVKDLMLEHLAEQLPRGFSVSAERVAAVRSVTLTVKEVSERFQTGMKEARQMLNEAVKTLYQASVKWRERSYYTEDGRRRTVPEVMTYEHRYLSGMGRTPDDSPVVNGKAVVLFDYDFARLLSRSGYVMFYHPHLYHINANVNRHSYYLGRKMCEHYNSIVRDYEAEPAAGRVPAKNANRLSVRNLLKVCPELPLYEEVMESGGAVRRRIIDPFEKDMYALCEKYGILTTWRYCNKKGEPLTNAQWQNLNYHDWADLYIEFAIADYPDQSKRLERKSRRSLKGQKESGKS